MEAEAVVGLGGAPGAVLAGELVARPLVVRVVLDPRGPELHVARSEQAEAELVDRLRGILVHPEAHRKAEDLADARVPDGIGGVGDARGAGRTRGSGGAAEPGPRARGQRFGERVLDHRPRHLVISFNAVFAHHHT